MDSWPAHGAGKPGAERRSVARSRWRTKPSCTELSRPNRSVVGPQPDAVNEHRAITAATKAQIAHHRRGAHYCRTDRIRPAPADAEGAPTIRGASNCPFREDEPGGSGVPWRNARRYSTPNHDCACITSARLGSQSPVMSRKRSLCRVAHLRNDQPGAEHRPQTKATMARFGWCTQNRR